MRLYRTHRPPRGALGAVLACGALFAAAGCAPAEPVRPNILLVVISGLRADHVSAYGYPKETTPAIDSLAREGVLYETALTAAAWSLASHASILTGRYPSEHGVSFSHPVLDESLETMAERLAGAGYETVAVTTDPALGEENGFGQGFGTFVSIHPEETGSPDEGAAQAVSRLRDWIRDREAPGQRPFFAYLVLKNPRLPLRPPEGYQEKFLDKPFPRPDLERLMDLWIPFARRFSLDLIEMPPEAIDAMIGLYDGEVAYADYRLGRLLDGLERAGVRGRTAILVTSDTGENLGEHGLLADSANLYEAQVRVPLVVRVPGAEGGGRVSGQVQHIDLLEAVTRLGRPPGSGGPPSDPLDTRRVVIIEAPFDPVAYRDYQRLLPQEDLSVFRRDLLAVRTPGFKYIATSIGTAALYDLAEDPAERASILETNTAKARELDAHLKLWATALRPPAGEPAPAAPAAGAPGRSGEAADAPSR